MARIVLKSDHQYRRLKELTVGSAEQQLRLKKNVWITLILFLTGIILISVNALLFQEYSFLLMIVGVSLVFAGLLGFVFSHHFPDHNKINQIQAGIDGEEKTAFVLSVLPQGYVLYRNVYIPCISGKGYPDFCEYDLIVVGKTGVTIVETKNYSGYISGSVEDRWLSRTRVSRYDVVREDTVENPVCQIGRQFGILRKFLEANGFRNCMDSALYIPNAETRMELAGQTKVGVFLEGMGGAEKLRQFIMTADHRLTDAAVIKLCNIFDRLETPSYDFVCSHMR